MSKYTEREILSEAIIAIDEYGRLSTTQLISVLREKMKPNGHDTDIIKGRADDYFSQKVRNLKSHNTLEKYTIMYEENRRNTIWYSKKTFPNIESPSASQIDKMNEEAKKAEAKNKKFIARFVDFVNLQEERTELGRLGELFLLEEKSKSLKDNNIQDAIVEHTSIKRGDGAGYDISVMYKDGEYEFIEVKTTKNNLNSPFFMSENERLFVELHQEEYILARVYDFDVETKKGLVKYYTGAELLKDFDFKANSHKVTLK